MAPNLEQQIRARAHQLWMESGCVDGRAEEHWRIAEQELVLTPADPKVRKAASASVSKSAKSAGDRKAPKPKTMAGPAKAA